ncbi:MAG: SDR family oxidoreductase [Limnochordaceae bacterium]|nr:SDR family oxidoreductase [Limnochordaceae bacterium]
MGLSAGGRDCPFSLDGQVVLVTGAGRGIGRAVALGAAALGAHVAVMARTAAQVREVARQAEAYGVHAVALPGDVRRRADVEVAVETAWSSLGPIDVLVNNAGAFEAHEFLATPYEKWRALVEDNLAGAFHCTQVVAARWVRARRAGRVVNVSSVNGSFGVGWSSAYNVAKSAIDELTRTWAVELAPYGIVVNAVAPGFIDTAMARARGESDFETEAFRRFYVGERRIPLARPGTPEEVAGAVLFFASPACRYVTGQVLAVDGGLSITY